jgi:hypothetical protein
VNSVTARLTEDELLALLPREPWNLAHCKRVAAVAGEIATAAQLPFRSADNLRQAAMLHHVSAWTLDPGATERLLTD